MHVLEHYNFEIKWVGICHKLFYKLRIDAISQTEEGERAFIKIPIRIQDALKSKEIII